MEVGLSMLVYLSPKSPIQQGWLEVSGYTQTFSQSPGMSRRPQAWAQEPHGAGFSGPCSDQAVLFPQEALTVYIWMLSATIIHFIAYFIFMISSVTQNPLDTGYWILACRILVPQSGIEPVLSELIMGYELRGPVQCWGLSLQMCAPCGHLVWSWQEAKLSCTRGFGDSWGQQPVLAGQDCYNRV